MNPSHPRTPLAAILAAPALVVAAVVAVWLYTNPELFLYLAGLAVFLFGGAALTVAVGARAERDELRTELERRERETTPVPLIPFDSLPKAERVHIAAERPDLHIVPPPVPDSWLEAACDEQERMSTPVHDGLAVETFMEQVEAWDVEAERES